MTASAARVPWSGKTPFPCETRPPQNRNLLVRPIIPKFAMMAVVVVAALAVLALVTQAGVFFLQHAYPAQGKPVEVAGAILNVVDIGPRDAAGCVGTPRAAAGVRVMKMLSRRQSPRALPGARRLNRPRGRRTPA